MPAAQDKFLPNEPNSGSLGDEAYPWAEMHTDRLFVNGEEIDTGAIGNGQWTASGDIPTDPTEFPTDRFHLHDDGRIFVKKSGSATWSVAQLSAASLAGNLSSSVTIDGGTI